MAVADLCLTEGKAGILGLILVIHRILQILVATLRTLVASVSFHHACVYTECVNTQECEVEREHSDKA